MTVAVSNEITSTIAYPAAQPAAQPASLPVPLPGGTQAASGGMSFGELLSDMNPLQYLPVVGTIYRAVTGDTIPKPLREAGSVVVSGLIGGPVGIATSLATLAFEKLTGIDFEETGQSVLSALGIGGEPTTATAAAAPAAAAPADSAAAPAADAQPASQGWTHAQLAAYGVVTQPDGTLRSPGLSGADVLNDLQLRQSAGTLVAA